MTDAEIHLSFDSEHRLRAENLSWDIDVWYPLVEDHTFRTIFIPLTVEEAHAIKAFHDVSWRHLRPRLTLTEVSVLRRLEAEIDKQIKCHFGPSGSFIRLCGRSPKDGEPLNRESVIQRYESKLQELLKNGTELTAHVKMLAIARTSWLQVNTGAEVMSLLLTSERVYADMIDWIRFGEPEQICLRDWDAGLTMDMEFRVFVCDHRITAISQYDHYAYYPHLLDQKETIQNGIERLFDTVHLCMKGLGNYIMDVGCLSMTDSGNDSGSCYLQYGGHR
jgi:hypothetical protein